MTRQSAPSWTISIGDADVSVCTDAQIIDDMNGRTVVAAGSLGLDGDDDKTEEAKRVGAELARRAKQAGIGAVVFDRGGYQYHGRIQALAEAAREGGLDF